MNDYLKSLAKFIVKAPYFSLWAVLFIDSFFSALSSSLLMIIMIILKHSDALNYWVLYTFGISFVITMIIFLLTNSNSGAMRHATMHEAVAILLSLLLRSVILFIFFICVINGGLFPVLISVQGLVMFILTDFCIACTLVIGLRLAFITIYHYAKSTISYKTINALVYDTDAKSISVTELIRDTISSVYDVRGFVIFSEESHNIKISGYPIFNFFDKMSFDRIASKISLEAVIFPDQIAVAEEKERLVQYCIDSGIKVMIQPEFSELDEDGNFCRQIREIRIEDLLGRNEISVDSETINSFISDKIVMVTGAAGSIGSELSRQISHMGCRRLILLDNAETPLHNIKLELLDKEKGRDRMTQEQIDYFYNFVIGDIRDQRRMESVFKTYNPQIIFHAAAYKHVPMMEDNPCEAVNVNVCGTRNVADLAVKYGVEKMVMVSTDKAVNPTNVMGCSKRLAEIYVQSLSTAILGGEVKGTTKFITTRFGNVLGSNGSVIPLFRDQIMKGGPVTVTHKDVIRYFMTIPEACNLVLEAATMGNGYEIFVFDMGKPVKISNLAKKMISLAGFVPDEDIKIVYSGLRPGEKLYEELLNSSENTIPTGNKKIFVAKVKDYKFNYVKENIQRLIDIAKDMKRVETVAIMKEIVPEFKSQNSIYCSLDK